MQLPTHKKTAVFATVFFFFVTLGSSFSHAQKLPDTDFFGGYSYLRLDSPSFGFSDYSGLNGWTAAVTAPHLYEELGLTINASGNYGSPLKVYNFLLGPQVSFEKNHLRLFGNILFGKAETKLAIHQPNKAEITSVGRAVALGGGVEMTVTPRIAWRLIDVDYIYSKTFNNRQNNIRLSTGLVYRFGRK